MRRRVLAGLLAALALRLAVLAGGGEILTAWGQRLDESASPPAETEPLATPVPTATANPATPSVNLVLRDPPRMEEAENTGETPPASGVQSKARLSPTVAFHDSSGLSPDLEALCAEGLDLHPASEGPQVLIVHTHSSEAYAQDAADPYEENDPYRTEDKTRSVIRVGDELAAALEESGLQVLHDREIYDWPSYAGSYSRSGASVERYLSAYPSLRVVIDLHRDAIGSGGTVYRTRATLDGLPSAQIMILVGTGANGLSHPNWRENLKLALCLQTVCEETRPSLMRPLELVKERYNQQLSPGSLILEVGSTGNSLREAIRAARLFGEAVGPVLAELTQG